MANDAESIIDLMNEEIGTTQEALNILADVEKKKEPMRKLTWLPIYIRLDAKTKYTYTYKRFISNFDVIGEKSGYTKNYDNIWDLAHDLKKYRNQLQQEVGWYKRYSVLGDTKNAKVWLMTMRTDNTTVAKCLHHARDIAHAKKYVHPSVRVELDEVLAEIRDKEEHARKNKSNNVQKRGRDTKS